MAETTTPTRDRPGAGAGAAGGGTAAHADEEEHPKRPYLAIAVVLAILTLIEVQVPDLGYQQSLTWSLLLAIATAKAAFVVAYYMHLKYETAALRLLPAAPLALVFILLLALFFGISPAP